MSEIRIDPITGRHVIFSMERDNRPSDLWNVKAEECFHCKFEYMADCPFCLGNEDMTPPEIDRISNGENWDIRIVPNKYPALDQMEASKVKRIKTSSLFQKYSGIGTHEVIVESSKHNHNYFNMDKEHFTRFISAVLKRYKEIIKNDSIDFVSFFKNYQKLAGASLFHPHSQMIGLGSVPDFIRYEIEGSKKYYSNSKTCPYCDILRIELKKRERLVYENNEFAVISPFAPKYKYELWVLPKAHRPYFQEEQNETELSDALYRAFHMLYKTLGDFPFNLYLHGLPKSMKDSNPYYHYHFEINPRISGNAGFEIGTGIYINSIFPEEATKTLIENYSLNIERKG
ncbi:UDPglucose--hexose-1-phosphate uridylyltransferase [Acetoanaerobium pronyense]|uniref:UDPglucose--hexose-1-phosphate uridylyltransferase n=1 Tax=Acetoanaerobium pronyense TaxID=1482736 RepID=A0ABS4KFM6_9FIRM|nr:DUF4931 domain-containing protein [Acetoanaerobium pronyense]MBP2026582.1 UDPglucose--hexose-1-phosphate uridylyltransferase [Acetoanaerobium pronyense]